jgi:hypothetical protein
MATLVEQHVQQQMQMPLGGLNWLNNPASNMANENQFDLIAKLQSAGATAEGIQLPQQIPQFSPFTLLGQQQNVAATAAAILAGRMPMPTQSSAAQLFEPQMQQQEQILIQLLLQLTALQNLDKDVHPFYSN